MSYILFKSNTVNTQNRNKVAFQAYMTMKAMEAIATRQRSVCLQI